MTEIMKNNYAVLGPVVLIIVLGIGAYALMRIPTVPPVDTGFAKSVTTPAGITFGYPDTYALATTPDQVTVKSYIPSCDQGFSYCVFRTDTKYAGTNFESAGLAVKPRTDLATKTDCLSVPPEGFASSTIPNGWGSGDGYFVSLFAKIGDAGAGHYSSGDMYRVFVMANSSCTEFQTRIGETQFANYPVGAKVEFSASDRASVQTELLSILGSMSVGGKKITLPTAQ